MSLEGAAFHVSEAESRGVHQEEQEAEGAEREGTEQCGPPAAASTGHQRATPSRLGVIMTSGSVTTSGNRSAVKSTMASNTPPGAIYSQTISSGRAPVPAARTAQTAARAEGVRARREGQRPLDGGCPFNFSERTR
jgi:hypothetical protein